MKTRHIAGLMVFSLLLLAAFSAFAAPAKWSGRGSGGWGMGTPYQNLFDPGKVESFTGEVVGLEQTTPMKRMNRGLALVVKADKETVKVHLGPDWYLERLDTKIGIGDQVEVKGARATLSGEPVILAAEVKKAIRSSYSGMNRACQSGRAGDDGSEMNS